MRGTARPGRLALTAALLLTVAAAGCAGASGTNGASNPVPGTYLVFGDGTNTMGMTGVEVGEPVLVGVPPQAARGTHPIHLQRVDVLGVPDGLVIDHVWASWLHGGGPNLGATSGTLALAQLQPFVRPVASVTLDPTCPPAARCYGSGPAGLPQQDWYFIVQGHITRPGRFVTQAIRVTYLVDGVTYSQESGFWRFAADSSRHS